MRASEFPGILPIAGFGFKASPNNSNNQQQNKVNTTQVQQSVQQNVVSTSKEPGVHQPQPKVQTVRAVPRGGNFSLANAYKTIADKHGVVEKRELGNDKFDIEAVKRAIVQYAESRSSESDFFLTLKSATPEVDGNNVVLNVDNKYSMELLTPNRQRIEGAIATFVNNGGVKLSINVVEIQNRVTKPVYITAAAKLEHFIELNPTVADFVELLGLELE